ncbi:MAG: delta-60 repeat domain-containing protein [bacterium]
MRTVLLDGAPRGALPWRASWMALLAGSLALVASAQTPSVDTDFNPGANNTVTAFALQPDGKILVGGSFTTLGGLTRNHIGRLHVNGSVDADFDPGANGDVSSLAVQPDGRIVVAGAFTIIGGQSRNHLACLETNGTVVAAFNPGVNGTISALAVQANGSIVLGGSFTTLGGVSCTNLARVDSSGTADATFHPNADDQGQVLSVAIQPSDGKILIVGTFTKVGTPTTSHNRIARILSNGLVDGTFTASAGLIYEVPFVVTVQANDSILVGGSFTRINTTDRNNLARMDSSGVTDSTFNPNVDQMVYALAMQSDGKILLAGTFGTVGGSTRNYIARIGANGTVDAGFDMGAGGNVNALAVQADGKILVGGQFSSLGSVNRAFIGRLNATGPATNALSYNGSTITWLRGGTAAEVWRTTFESTTNGTTWNALGAGTRVAGGWQLTGVAAGIPMIRARGYTLGGYVCGSDGIVETILGLPYVDVTNANRTVIWDVDALRVAGTNNASVVGTMRWTNNLTGGSGIFAAGAAWQSAPIGLAAGTNLITVSGTNAFGMASSDNVSYTRQDITTGSPFVAVTNLSGTVSYDVAALAVAGTNNASVVGSMRWTNSLTGGSGTFPVQTPWQIPSVNLAVGANPIVVSGSNSLGVAATGSVTITRGGIGTGTPFVDVTNQSMTVDHLVAAWAIGGTNNAHVVGAMRWTNGLSGGSGTFPAASPWLAAGIRLNEGANPITVTGTNLLGMAAADTVTIIRNGEDTSPGPFHFVATNGLAVWPYTNWTTAAQVLQDAIFAASPGDTVLVSNGVYNTGGMAVYGAMTNRVALTKAVTVRSVNGASVTAIAGQPCPANGACGDGAIRCAYLTNGASLIGFTLTNGFTRAGGDELREQSGGGVWSETWAESIPYVAACILVGNSAAVSAGGAYDGVYGSCLFTGNSAPMGGGARMSQLENCTIAGNAAASTGGGVAGAVLHNCIVYDNEAPSSMNVAGSSVSYTCSTPLVAGDGNITSAPMFANAAAGNFRLQPGSPCINAGENAGWLDATDLDGNLRPIDSRKDMGAYESYLPFLAITNPVGAVTNDATTCAVGGREQNLAGTLQWTNSLTGDTGCFAPTSSWQISGISLGAGTNVITVSGTNPLGAPASGAVTIIRRMTYGVTFDLAGHGARTGGGALSQTVVRAEAAVAPVFTVAPGWIFTGWDRPFANVVSDLAVTAQYNRVVCTVSFALGIYGSRAGGGALTQTVYYGDAAVPPAVEVAPSWRLMGWRLDPPGTALDHVTASVAATALYGAVHSISGGGAFAYAANPGWVNFAPSAAEGVAFGDHFLSGYAYAANFGWICFGDGNPTNGIRYTNVSGNDCGVNHNGAGGLSGYAYGANVGWINFGWTGSADTNHPRVDLATGAFAGYAYGANIGWIDLGSGLRTLRMFSLDLDGDGIPDAWEKETFGNLTAATANGNADHDPVSDRDEYLAGTNANDPGDYFAIKTVAYHAGNSQAEVTFRTVAGRFYLLETCALLGGGWSDSGLGLITPDAGPSTTRTISWPGSAARFIHAVAVVPLQP